MSRISYSIPPGQIEVREGPQNVLKAYAALVAKNSSLRLDASGQERDEKRAITRQMAALYAKDLRPRLRDIMDMPLRAAAADRLEGADNTDANIGTLSGTIVAQETLELFKLQFPVFTRVYTDFSDTPAQFGQTENTRIVVTPAVSSYDATSDATGRPKGWVITVPAKTIDVPIKLDEHIGVPIMFDSNQLASTTRKLFQEQAPAAMYAFSKYFIEKVYALITPANFNSYAVVAAPKVPQAYATYPVAQADFARSSLVKIASIFNPNEVPIHDRTALLNSSYFGQLGLDPSLVTFFAGQRAPEIITDSELPKLGTFLPMECPNLNATNQVRNLVGFAMQRNALIIKCRVSNDYSEALPGASYGSVTTVSDSETGLTLCLVQYVNHTGGYAEWRLQGMIGAAAGDKRGGLCIMSQ